MPLMLATGSGPPAMSLAENPLVEYASTLLAGVSAGGAGLLGFVEFLPCRMSFIWPCDVAMVRGGFWRIIFPEMPICIHPCLTALYSVLSVGDPSAALANATCSACLVLLVMLLMCIAVFSGVVWIGILHSFSWWCLGG